MDEICLFASVQTVIEKERYGFWLARCVRFKFGALLGPGMVEKDGDPDIIDDPVVADTLSVALRRQTGLTSEVLQNAILMSAGLSVIVTDIDGMIQLFNLGAERMLGYFAADMVDRINVVDLHDPQQLEARARAVSRELSTTIARDFEALTCKASRETDDRYESTLIAKNRKPVPVGIVITVMRDGFGRIDGYLLVVTDISAGAHARIEPYEARSPTETVDFSELALLAHMTHEMRTPLSAILGFSQLMDSATPAPTVSQKRSLDLILQAGWQLQYLINMTSDLALIESGRLSLSPKSVPLGAVMLDVQARIESQARMRRIHVTFPLFETPCFVSADRDRLQQVLDTVVSAATEYSPVGGALVVDCDTHSPEWIRICVSDGRVADPQKEPAAAAGTDIGLLLARRLVQLMGGAIGPECIVGSRQVFSLDLKRMPANVDEWLETPDGHFNACKTSAPNAMTRQMT